MKLFLTLNKAPRYTQLNDLVTLHIKYAFFIILSCLISFSASAQNEELTPDWTFGAEKGYAQIGGEITPQNGFGLGIFAQKNFGALFGARLHIGMGDMRGLDRVASEKWREHPVWNGTRNGQINYNDALTPKVFANYQTIYREASLQGVFNLTRLSAFKNKSPYDLFLTAGIGGMQFQTSVDAEDTEEKIYDFSKIQINTNDTEAKTLTDLDDLFDGKFETDFEEKMTFTPLFQIGAGVSRTFRENLAFELKHQVSFTNTDLLDSYTRNAENIPSAGNDIWHFTTISLSYTIFKPKKITPPDEETPPVVVVVPEVDTIPGGPDITEEEEDIVKKAFNNLEFETGLALIRETSFPTLNELANLLQQHPEWRLQISGHTDNAGDADYNMQLSRDRADAVRVYLQARNISGDRFLVEWFGEEQPIASNDTPEGKQKNRRVELKIID